MTRPPWWRLVTARGRRDVRSLRRLDRALASGREQADPARILPTIEQIAHDLRRLEQQRRSGSSERWLAAVLRAYDERLKLASRALGIGERLDSVPEEERERERVRVERALRDSGLEVRVGQGRAAPSRVAGVAGSRSRPAARLVGLLTFVLPAQHRGRYLEEFGSELYELARTGASRRQQVWYALRLLDRAWVLRAELREARARRARP